MDRAPCQFETLWTLSMRDFEFKTQVDADNLEALEKASSTLQKTARAMAPGCALQLSRAEMCFSTYHEPSGTHEVLNDAYEEIFETFIGLTDVEDNSQNVQHYMNHATGSYNRLMNRVTPDDFGITFPDGSVRVMWDIDECIWLFDEAYERYSTFLTVLLEMSRHNYFNATDDELDEADYEGEQARKMGFLSAQGLLPNENGEWVEMAKLDAIQAAIDALPESA